jgi:hypothetical protein
MTEILRFNAGNDANGNPRRVFVEIASGQPMRAWVEGYEGHHAVPAELRHAAKHCATLPTTVKGYRDLLKLRTFS